MRHPAALACTLIIWNSFEEIAANLWMERNQRASILQGFRNLEEKTFAVNISRVCLMKSCWGGSVFIYSIGDALQGNMPKGLNGIGPS